MLKDNKEAEDVAAVLRGMVKCPNCRGSGVTWELSSRKDPDAEKEGYECDECWGRRWITQKQLEYWVADYSFSNRQY